MSDRSKYQLTKHDAARRQLETAIRLYFHDGDAISTHTLVCAAVGIINALLTLSGKNDEFSSLETLFLNRVKDEHRQSVRRQMRAAQNFFKHADMDGHAIIEFSPASTEHEIFWVIQGYHRLFGELTPLMQLFHGWFLMHNQPILSDEGRALFAPYAPLFQGYSKAKYFSEALPLIERSRVG